MKIRTQSILAGGVVAGLIGYVTAAVILAGFSLLSGHSPFHAAFLMGQELFYRTADPLELEVAPVAAFNAIHMLAFLAIGILSSWFFVLGERYPNAQYLLFAVLVLVGLHIYFGVALFARTAMGVVAWWQVALAGLVAAVGMGAYLLRTHPLLVREIREHPWDLPPTEPAPAYGGVEVKPLASTILSTSEFQALEQRRDALSRGDVSRLLTSHEELSKEVARLREGLRAADNWLDEGGRVLGSEVLARRRTHND